MPMKYNEDTGIPYFVPDTAIELEEGVTPKPDVLRYGKRGIFAGDPPPKFDNGLNDDPMAVERLIKGALDPKPKAKGAIRDYPGKPAAPSDSEFFAKLTQALVPPDNPPAGPPDSPIQKAYDEAFPADTPDVSKMARKLSADIDKLAKHATPAALSAKIATNQEIDELERLAQDHRIENWPTFMRLINRLRMTEELLEAARRGR